MSVQILQVNSERYFAKLGFGLSSSLFRRRSVSSIPLQARLRSERLNSFSAVERGTKLKTRPFVAISFWTSLSISSLEEPSSSLMSFSITIPCSSFRTGDLITSQ